MASGHSDRVADHFRTHWQNYDRQIRASVPLYDASLDLLVDVLVRGSRHPARILDLGVGTGNLAARLLAAFPEASLTGVDVNTGFLRIAEKRLQPHSSRVRLVEADVDRFDFRPGYDLIVSAFMFHHVPNSVKRGSCAKALSRLSDGGCFVNADFVDSASRHWSRVFDELRMACMRAEGVSEEGVNTQYVEHRALEIPLPLEVQLDWLSELGFEDVECFWKYLNLAIFGGRKPSRE